MATGPCSFDASWTTEHDSVHKHVDSLRCVPVLTFAKDFPDNLCYRNRTQVWFCYEVALASTIRIAQPCNSVLVYQCQQNIACQNILDRYGQHCDTVVNESTRFWTPHDFVSASSHYSFELSFQWRFRKFRSYDFSKVSFRELNKRPFLTIPRIQQLEKILLAAFSIDFIKPSTRKTSYLATSFQT